MVTIKAQNVANNKSGRRGRRVLAMSTKGKGIRALVVVVVVVAVGW
jgi:hypothetical protein